MPWTHLGTPLDRDLLGHLQTLLDESMDPMDQQEDPLYLQGLSGTPPNFLDGSRTPQTHMSTPWTSQDTPGTSSDPSRGQQDPLNPTKDPPDPPSPFWDIPRPFWMITQTHTRTPWTLADSTGTSPDQPRDSSELLGPSWELPDPSRGPQDLPGDSLDPPWTSPDSSA